MQFSAKRRHTQYPAAAPQPRTLSSTQLLQVSDINHQLNVNKKYEHLSRIREGATVGQGFKKVAQPHIQTFGYDCLTTPSELAAKRK